LVLDQGCLYVNPGCDSRVRQQLKFYYMLRGHSKMTFSVYAAVGKMCIVYDMDNNVCIARTCQLVSYSHVINIHPPPVLRNNSHWVTHEKDH